MRRRVAALWFPRLAADRVLRRERGIGAAHATSHPFAIVAEQGRAMRLVSLNRAAEAAGLRLDMSLADARAIAPDLITRPADPPEEAAFLDRLRRWALRYSPWVARDGAAGLALDVTGCAHLFGGELAMLRDMLARLQCLDVDARAGLADAKAAARALAQRGAALDGSPVKRTAKTVEKGEETAIAAPEAIAIAEPGRTRAAVGPLPVSALGLEPETTASMRRLGLRTIEELARLPRGSSARRFGLGAVRALDQMLGAEPDPLSPSRPTPVFAARLSLPEPIGRLEDLEAGLGRLLDRLCARLQAEGQGARRLAFSLRLAEGETRMVEIGLARPSRDPARIKPLFLGALERVQVGFGVDALRLEATVVEPLSWRQIQTADPTAPPSGAQTAADNEAMERLLNRLGARLGFDRLTRLTPADSHLPERAFTVASAMYAPPVEGWAAARAARPPRPLSRLLEAEPIAAATPTSGRAPPARFRWRGASFQCAAAVGPERIAPEWWLDHPTWRSGVRDYWRVETETGLRLWLFHTPQSPVSPSGARWFVAGLFA